jgi:hypothetical protein
MATTLTPPSPAPPGPAAQGANAARTATTVAAGRRGVGGLLRDLGTTTPGRLRLESLVVLLLAAAAGLFTTLVVASRVSDTVRINDETAPVIVSARQVQTSLAEANAAAANSFVAGGVEDRNQRALYEASLADAGRELEQAARLVDQDSEAHEALQALNVALPRYAGLIETARANNRQGFPVGAAYLNAATRLLEAEVYPATDVVANRAAASYRSAYDHQRNLGLVYGAVAVGLNLSLAAYLAWLLSHLRRRFRRTLNLPLLVALAVATALTGWLSYALVNQTARLETARTDGYQGTRLYLDARGIGFGARADEARFLIARGAGEGFEDSFQGRGAQITDTWASIERHAASSSRGGAIQDYQVALDAWTEYLGVHQALVEADRSGDRDSAVALALGGEAAGGGGFAAFDEATASALEANQAQFRAEMDRAQQALGGLRWGSLVAVLLVVAAAAYGLQLRINEYR